MVRVRNATVLSAVVWAAATVGAGLPAAVSAAPTCPIAAGPVNVTTATVPQLRAALAAGTVTSRRLTEAYLARIAAVNHAGPALHAVITVAPNALAQADAADAARAAGRPAGPLRGIPVLVKDNLDTFDLPTTAGAVAMLGAPPPRDAFIVARLRAAGAVILGKANMSEWATSVSPKAGLSWSDTGGRAINPYDRGDTSGSSNGSAIAAAASLAPLTVGSETQGSIILPSFLNSAAGLKPTVGLVSRGGVVPLIPEFDTPGPIARDVTDVAVELGLLTGVDPRDPVTKAQRGHVSRDYTRFLRRGALRGVRIGVVPNSGGGIGAITGKARIERVLRRLGARLVPIREKLFVGVPGKSVLGSFRNAVNAYLKGRGPTSPRHSLDDVIAFNDAHGTAAVRYGQDFLLDAQKVSAKNARTAHAVTQRFVLKTRRAMDDALRRNRVKALLVSRGVSSITNTSGGNPAITVQAGYHGRTPYGMVLTGPRWSEGRLIAYAYAFEQATHAYRSPARIDPAFRAACAS
jgi:amidase